MTAGAVALALVPGGAASAPTGLGGYDLSAHAPGLRVIVDTTLIPAPTPPAIDADVPETSASLESGPLGHGLATVFWPGDLGGHAGTALQVLGQVCTSMLPVPLPNSVRPLLPSVPPICEPIPKVIEDHAGSLNDPVKAESFSPGGPGDSAYSFPGTDAVVMHSVATDTAVTSQAAVKSFDAATIGQLGSVQSRSTATIDHGHGVTQAESELDNVSLLGGLVTVDHVLSRATETTDGRTASGSGSTVFNGVRIAGVAALVDRNGLHVSQVVSDVLAKAGASIGLVPAVVQAQGAKGSFTAPTLVIHYTDVHDPTLQTLTGNTTLTVTVALGGAVAAANATPEFVELPPTGPASSPLPASSGPVPSPGPNEPTPFVTPAVGSLASAPPRRPTSAPLPFVPSGGLTWWVIVIGALGAAATAVGLYALSVQPRQVAFSPTVRSATR